MMTGIIRALAVVAVSASLGGTARAQLVPGVPGSGSPMGWALSWASGMANAAAQAGETGKLSDLMKDYEPLSKDDQAQDANYPPGPGQLPSTCAEKEEACKECGFSAALEELQSTRYRLEKLRRVYASATNVKAHGLAVGDSLAGAAGVGGLAWATERRKILESFKNVQTSYDAKYAELMALLQGSLQKIAACELAVYDEKDWYQRYGFMYYEFMAGRYQRAD